MSSVPALCLFLNLQSSLFPLLTAIDKKNCESNDILITSVLWMTVESYDIDHHPHIGKGGKQ